MGFQGDVIRPHPLHTSLVALHKEIMTLLRTPLVNLLKEFRKAATSTELAKKENVKEIVKPKWATGMKVGIGKEDRRLVTVTL